MNIKLALKSAAVSLALVFAAIPVFSVEPATNYVPTDASAIATINVESLLSLGGDGAFRALLNGYFSDKIPGNLESQIVFFVCSGERRAMIVNTNGKTSIAKQGIVKTFSGNGQFEVEEPFEFDGAEVLRRSLSVRPNSSEVRNEFTSFVSKDQFQVLFSEDESMKEPVLFKENDNPSGLVLSMGADGSIVSVAMDMDAFQSMKKETKYSVATIGILLHCILTNNRKYMQASDEVCRFLVVFVDLFQDVFFKKTKTLVFRIVPGEDDSVDMVLSICFKTAEFQAEFAEECEEMKKDNAASFMDSVVKALTSPKSETENDSVNSLKTGIGNLFESMTIEVKDDEIVFSRNLPKDPDSINASFDAIFDLLALKMSALLMQKMPNKGGGSGSVVDIDEPPPDFEAMVPLEETPDPDEEGIDDEEREKRVQMREEAVKNREAKIAQLRLEYEANAAARAEARRVAKLNKEMFGYLKEKDWENAFRMIEEGADVNGKDEKGRTPAFYCVENGNFTILSNLDSAGKSKVDPNAVDKSGMSLLHCAVLKKQESIVTYLLKVRACTARTQIEKSGATPLYDAARIGTAENVKSLVTFGADVNAATTKGLTALHQAAARGNLDMVKELVQAGADVNAIAENGRTPIFYAAERGKASTVNYLLEKKAEINLDDENGVTPLHLAAASGNVALVKFMVTRKANFAATANDGVTVLIAGAKYPEIVKFLADKMPNVNGVDKNGNSVMHLCAETADEETIRKLLYYSAKEDLPNKKGETPILLAARAGNVDLVKRLLNMNVKVTQKIVDEAKTQEIKDLLTPYLKK